MPKGHLVSCPSTEDLRRFIEEGIVGLGPFPPAPESNDAQVRSAIRTNWDVVADLMRVEEGDYCFLHALGADSQFYGPFRFSSSFRESARLSPHLSTRNLTRDYWAEHQDEIAEGDHDGWAYVAAIDVPEEGVCAGKLMAIFLAQAEGEIHSVPPRFQYGDTRKIVKPLLHYEVDRLCSITGFPATGLEEWRLDEVPDYVRELSEPVINLSFSDGSLAYEKILEAWFMRMMGDRGDNRDEVVEIVGEYDYFANSVYTYYTNVLDVMSYEYIEGELCRECGARISGRCGNVRIAELKRGRQYGGLSEIAQLREYVEWANTVLEPPNTARGVLVSAGYSGPYLQAASEADLDNISVCVYSESDDGVALQKVEV